MFDIITDSACDLTLDTAKQLQIEVVPFYVSLDGEHSVPMLLLAGMCCVWCSPAR